MPAGFTKNDPQCGSPSQMVFVGNIGLQNFTETDPRFADHGATAELAIDAIAPEGFEMVEFQDITITMEVLAPAEATFTDHSNRNNYHWDVPDGAGGWTEKVSASSLIRIRVDESQLISGPGNGLTFYVGVTGLNGNALKLTAVAAASEVRALASSCAITVSDLTGGDRLPGYLG